MHLEISQSILDQNSLAQELIGYFATAAPNITIRSKEYSKPRALSNFIKLQMFANVSIELEFKACRPQTNPERSEDCPKRNQLNQKAIKMQGQKTETERGSYQIKSKQTEFICRLWAQSDQDLLPTIMDSYDYNIVLQGRSINKGLCQSPLKAVNSQRGHPQYDINSRHPQYDINSIFIGQIAHLAEIVRLDRSQLDRKIRLMRIIRQSQRQFQSNQSRHSIKGFAQELSGHHNRKNVKKVSKWIAFYIAKRESTRIKYFNAWSIASIQGRIQRTSQKIALMFRIPNQTLRKVFQGWKQIKIT